MQLWCHEGLHMGHGWVLRAQGWDPPSDFHPLIASLSSLQPLPVRLSEFVVVSTIAEHLGMLLERGPSGGMAGTPRSCCEPTHTEFNSFKSADVEQMWLCLDGARCQLSSRESLEKWAEVWAEIQGALSFSGEPASTPTDTLFCCRACAGAHVRQQFATGTNNVYYATPVCFLLQTWQPGAEHKM